MNIYLTINGEQVSTEIQPGDILLDTLRSLGYKGAKRGCDTGYCGACTVLLDGIPVNSCMVFTIKAEGKEITTVEGLGTQQKPHILQANILEAGGVQCGYCTPGLLLSAKALLDRNPDPNEDEIKEAIGGNLCRCTGYIKPIEAIKKTAQDIKKSK